MRKRSPGLPRKRSLLWALAVLLGVGFAPEARADVVLALSSYGLANVKFHGNGPGATFVFNNDLTSHEGFQISDGANLIGYGTIGGTFSYTTPPGSSSTATVNTVGGLLTIVDASKHTLTAKLAGEDIGLFGVVGGVNFDGGINLTNATYNGTNADLLRLEYGVNHGGGVLTISFQFTTTETLKQLAKSGSNMSTTYSGSISTLAVPEPSSLVLGCAGALGLLGYARRRKRARA